jgi:hypothetical protein
MNKIGQENAIIEDCADSSYWDVAHCTEIEGFTTDMSGNTGAHVDFEINGGAGSDYKAKIFRPGITVREGALIGMGALVLHDAPAGVVVVGYPARLFEQLAAQSGAPGQMRHGRVARRSAAALSQE